MIEVWDEKGNKIKFTVSPQYCPDCNKMLYGFNYDFDMKICGHWEITEHKCENKK